MNWISWAWLILAAILIIGEIFTAGFFLLWFGIAAAAAAVTAFLGGGLVFQWIVFILFSGVLWAGSKRFAKRILKNIENDSVGANRFKGLKGMVIEDIDNKRATGMVRIEREEWRAEGVDEDSIPKGTRVEVVDVSGTHLLVKVLVEQAV
ncbi:MAG: NfeD family protein [Candidatus Eisenbacteria bacterium]|uniref:NfeD family protein n=1 Tax=Eiseniibacteriota bacterium TaxID=2212470 RepID=A0A948RUN9_UNCEI|nr:NfeD family protein [Candidatus Eisenbacteria bacterium]MBU1951000.1 NfeD family protein [Candidatus Eisenbacteria bacterium]MBU2690029.1 NfeD family protein [Candidatus Eisenbacteria bacterium]